MVEGLGQHPHAPALPPPPYYTPSIATRAGRRRPAPHPASAAAVLPERSHPTRARRCRPTPRPRQLSNVLNTEQLFYSCIFPFIAFFGAFAYVMYPMKDQLHPTRASLAWRPGPACVGWHAARAAPRRRRCCPAPKRALAAHPTRSPTPHVLPAEWSQNLLEQMGPRFAGPIAIIRNWTFCLFYVMAELWGSVSAAPA